MSYAIDSYRTWKENPSSSWLDWKSQADQLERELINVNFCARFGHPPEKIDDRGVCTRCGHPASEQRQPEIPDDN